jgi:CHASE3 domain sensor protein
MFTFLIHAMHFRRTRLRLTLIALASATVAAGAVIASDARELAQDRATLHEASAVLAASARVMDDLRDAETGQRGFLLTGKDSYLGPYRKGVADVNGAYQALTRAAGADAFSAPVVKRMAVNKNLKLEEMRRTVDLFRSGDHALAVATVGADTGKRYMDAIRIDMASLQAEWTARRDAVRDESELRFESLLVGLAIAAALVLALIAYIIAAQRGATARADAGATCRDVPMTEDHPNGLSDLCRMLVEIDRP